MNPKIKAFINDNYLPFYASDLMFRILGYFFYSFIMIIPTEFILTDVQKNGFVYISFTAEYVKPLIIGAIICSTIISIITTILYVFKTKWSVIAIRAVSFGYISLTLLGLSCFSNLNGSDIFDIITIVLKILIYISCFPIYINYLYKKKLPTFDPKKKGSSSSIKYMYVAPILLLLTKPLLNLLFNQNWFNISIYPLITGTEYLVATSCTINVSELFTKAYYAKKYNL